MRGAPATFVAIVWGCARHLWPEIVQHVRKSKAVVGVDTCEIRLDSPPTALQLEPFVRAVYAVEDLAGAYRELKLSALARCSKAALVLNISVSEPSWRTSGRLSNNLQSNGRRHSKMINELKLRVRHHFASHVDGYVWDTIFHAADNETQTAHIEALLRYHRCVKDSPQPLELSREAVLRTARQGALAHVQDSAARGRRSREPP